MSGNKLIGCLFLLMSMQSSIFANDEFISEQRDSYDTVTPEELETTRKELLKMADETLERLYKEHPKTKEEIKNAYGYGIFEGKSVNLVMYVAGRGQGVVFDNKTKTPVFMNAIRAGTGPGVGYKSIHGVIIFDNEMVYKQFTSIGLQVSASGDAMVKVAGHGVDASESASLVPGVSLYQLVDSGLVLQANWGATEFLKDPQLNK
jgi:lipid-binding SYLF domain-containing protein